LFFSFSASFSASFRVETVPDMLCGSHLKLWAKQKSAQKNSPIKAFLADSIKKPHTPQDGQSILCV
jgi:hypothetical protein